MAGIQLKYETGNSTDTPINSDIARGELILNTQAGKLWYGDNSNNVAQFKITTFDATADRLFYSDSSGNVAEIGLGTDGQVLTSTGVSSAPAFEAVASGSGTVGSGAAGTFAVYNSAGTTLVDSDFNGTGEPDGAIYYDTTNYAILKLWRMDGETSGTNGFGALYFGNEDFSSDFTAPNASIVSQGGGVTQGAGVEGGSALLFKTIKAGDAAEETRLKLASDGAVELIGNSANPAKLRLYEDTDLGTNYTEFKVGTQAADINYTLPTDDGSDGEFLQTDGSGVLTWESSTNYGSSGSGNVNADNIGSGTLPMARLSGTLPALNGSALTNLPTQSDVNFTSADHSKLDGIAASANNYSHSTNANSTGDVTSVGNATTIATDAVDIAMLSATGTASSSTFLRGDNSWVTPTDTNTTYSVGAGGLTQQNFTTTLKSKLDGIAASANNYSHSTNANLTGDVTSSGNATTIATDAVDIAMLSATGTASSSTYLRGDNTWAAVSSGSGDMTGVDLTGGTGISIGSETGTTSGDYSATITNSGVTSIVAGSNVSIDAATGAVTITATDTNTVYTHPTSAGNKHVPTGGSSGQFLKYSSSGTAVWAADNNTDTNTTYSAGSNMSLSGTTFSATDTNTTYSAGTNMTLSGTTFAATDTDTVYTHPTSAGNKHVPTGGSSGQFLKYSSSGTAVWAADNNTDTNTTYSAGSNMSLSGTTFSATDTNTTYSAGSNMSLSGTTFSATDTNTTYSVTDGQLSEINFTSADHTKLNGIASSANNYSHPTGAGNNHVPTGGSSAQVLTYSSSGVAVWADAAGGGSGASLTGSTNNTVCTVTGADAFTGEGTFTFDGSGVMALTDRDATITLGTSHPAAAPAYKLYDGTSLKTGTSTDFEYATSWVYDAMAGQVMATGSATVNVSGGIVVGYA
jgi:hypothetical protein